MTGVHRRREQKETHIYREDGYEADSNAATSQRNPRTTRNWRRWGKFLLGASWRDMAPPTPSISDVWPQNCEGRNSCGLKTVRCGNLFRSHSNCIQAKTEASMEEATWYQAFCWVHSQLSSPLGHGLMGKAGYQRPHCAGSGQPGSGRAKSKPVLSGGPAAIQ